MWFIVSFSWLLFCFHIWWGTKNQLYKLQQDQKHAVLFISHQSSFLVWGSDVSRQTVLFPFFFLGHHLQTIVTHNIWRPRRVSYPRWRLRWQERWWLTGPRPPWWPDSFGDETSSSARSGRGSVGEERDARCLTQTLHDKGGGGG